MSAPSTRRRRRGQDDTPDTNHGAIPVTLTSREFIGKLLSEYRENTKAAHVAEEEANRAFKDAARFEQQVAQLGAKEQAALAKVQQAQAEFKQVQAERQEAGTFAEQARKYGATQAENQKDFTGQAADARKVLDQFNIAIPEDADQDEPSHPAPLPSPAPVTSPFPVQPVDPTADDPRMDGPARRFNEAHDVQDREESEGER